MVGEEQPTQHEEHNISTGARGCHGVNTAYAVLMTIVHCYR